MPAARGLNLFRRFAEPPAALPPAHARRRCAALALARDEGLVEAAYSYRIVPLTAANDGRFELAGETLPAPWLVPESGQLTALACAVCTIGPRLDARIRDLFQARRAALALELDRLGNQLLAALNRVLQDRMHGDVRRRGLSMAGELRSGDPGLGIETQPGVLRLAAADTIGIGLGHGVAIAPSRSLSMVLGVGIDLPPVRWSRCDDCPSRARCGVVAGRA
jgi:hypothetical protein